MSEEVYEVVRGEADSVIETLSLIQEEISKAIVGQKRVINEVLTCLLCRGHALIEGVPGLGKTYLIKSLAEVLDLESSRIQFTPDLMPADILGTNVLFYDEKGVQSMRFNKGPIFGNIILADEINRATPKTQSALLEAMQEETISIGTSQYSLESPFMVLATQNPIELEGTYPLPEAQLDRFFFKIFLNYPGFDDLKEIIARTTMGELPVLQKVTDSQRIKSMQHFIKQIPIAETVSEYAIKAVLASHPWADEACEMSKKYIRYGASPRAAQSLVLAAKVSALLADRLHVGFEDIRNVAAPALRHRIILNFEGEASGISVEEIIEELLKTAEDLITDKV